MNTKIDTLMHAEGDLPPKMLTDTREPQIKELRANSKEALRLLLCKGPVPQLKGKEFTLLFGCREKDRRYDPKDAPEIAERRRQLVLQDPKTYRVLRTDAYPK